MEPLVLGFLDQLPEDDLPRISRKPIGRKPLYDDPRFDKDWDAEEHEFDDVVPIPFFPPDLPTLELDPFLWSPAELSAAVSHARKLVIP